MSDPYLGEIRMFGGNFAPRGWNFCEGQLLDIGENQALFTLIGTTYGGDGVTTFGLPDLRGRVPAHQGSGWNAGQQLGVETVTLSSDEIPPHTHMLLSTNQLADSPGPGNNVPASTNSDAYTSSPGPVAASALAITSTGGSGSHENMQPYLAVSFIIAVEGIYPTQ